TYEIPVKITYLDELRNSLTTWINVSIGVQGSGTITGIANESRTAVTGNSTRAYYRRGQEGGGFLDLIIGAIVVVVAAVLAFLFVRGRKRRKQKEQKEKR